MEARARKPRAKGSCSVVVEVSSEDRQGKTKHKALSTPRRPPVQVLASAWCPWCLVGGKASRANLFAELIQRQFARVDRFLGDFEMNHLACAPRILSLFS